MSSKYKFADNDKLYFVSFAVTNWIDILSGKPGLCEKYSKHKVFWLWPWVW